jgi:subtilisin-like proprotein convertase family protein
MGQGRPRLRLIAALALAVTLAVGLSAGAAEAKKKKKGGPGSVDVTNATAVSIPDAGPSDNPAGVARSTIEVGRQFKGKRIRDVNTTIQLTGSDADATGDITAVLSAPSGASVILVSGQGGSTQLGPLTLDDESANRLGSGTPTQAVPGTLFAPYQGSARPPFLPFALMDNGAVRGTWTLTLVDFDNGDTTVLNSWRLQVAAGKPFKTKP